MTPEENTTNQAAEALHAPWVACLADLSGWLIDERNLDDHDSFEVTVQIVRSSAAPGARDDGEDERLPGTYQSRDHLVTFDDFEDLDEARTRWMQAQAMVAGLNAAAATLDRSTVTVEMPNAIEKG